MARASGVGFELTSLPMGRGVKRFARMNGLAADGLVLAGGEEYVVVGTAPRRRIDAARRAARKCGGELLVIGEATSRKGRVLLRSNGSTVSVADEGWTHLG